MFGPKRQPKIKRNEELEAAALLLGENYMICSCCLGWRGQSSIFGGFRRCAQCGGSGYDLIGPKTTDFMRTRDT